MRPCTDGDESDFSAAVDEQCGWEGLEIGNLVLGRLIADHQRVVDPVFLGERLDSRDRVGGTFVVDSDDLQSLFSVGLLQFDEVRHFGSAGRAPGPPDVHDHDLALQLGQRHRFAVEVGQREGKRERLVAGQFLADRRVGLLGGNGFLLGDEFCEPLVLAKRFEVLVGLHLLEVVEAQSDGFGQ